MITKNKMITLNIIIIDLISSCFPMMCDGEASGKVITWIDENANGIFDTGEQPLAGE
jgi:hypothetical protein